jgi:hypothetical protein
MATRSFTTQIPTYPNGSNVPGALIITWTGLLNGDDGAPYTIPNRADKSVQVFGTFGAGGSCRVEGTNQQAFTPDGTAIGSLTYAALNDPQGNVLDVTAAKIEQVLENPNAIRPRVTAGDGTTSLTVVMVVTSVLKGF